MGWFRKSKKVEEKVEETTKPETTENVLEKKEVQVKSHEEILKEQHQNELDAIESEIKKKNDNLKSISKKLASVKEEYDIAVANLMKTKKDWQKKKIENEALQKDHEEILLKIGKSKSDLDNIDNKFAEEKKKLEELDKVDTALAEVKAEVEKNKTESASLKQQILQSQQIYDQVKAKQTEAETELNNTHSRIKNVREEILKLQAQGQASLISNETQSIQAETGEASKNVVEAASAVVANTKHKLMLVQKELDIVKKLLEKERKEHQQTKEKLEEMQSKKEKSQEETT